MNNPAPGASRPIDPDDPWAGIEPDATGESFTIVDIDARAGKIGNGHRIPFERGGHEGNARHHRRT